jgi:hypothetical protein
MKYFDISFSRDRFDQWRMQEAGGYITYDKRGRAIFRFPDKESFEKYKALNSKRYEAVK